MNPEARDEMRAVFATQDHWVEATVKIANQRLLEAFQGSNSDYLVLREATMLGREGDSHPIMLPDCVLLKSQVLFAFPASEKHESPVRRWNTVVSKNQHSAFLIVPGHSISGQLHLKGTADNIPALTQELGNFLSVTQVSIHSTSGQRTPLEVSTAIVNKAFVSFFSIGQQVPNAGVTETPSIALPSKPPACEFVAKELEIRYLISELQKLVAEAHAPVNESQRVAIGS